MMIMMKVMKMIRIMRINSDMKKSFDKVEISGVSVGTAYEKDQKTPHTIALAQVCARY